MVIHSFDTVSFIVGEQQAIKERDDARRWAKAWKKFAKWYWTADKKWAGICRTARETSTAERDDAVRWAAVWKQAAKYMKANFENCEEFYFSAEAENKKLREALEMVEWITDDMSDGYCPWCEGFRLKSEARRAKAKVGHKHDCARQLALGIKP